MKILVVADGHYFKKSNGDYYVDSVFDYNFYKRYLSVFDDVYAIVRTVETDDVPSYAKKASGDSVHFLPIDDSVGAKQFFVKYKSTKAKIKEYIKGFDKAKDFLRKILDCVGILSFLRNLKKRYKRK